MSTESPVKPELDLAPKKIKANKGDFHVNIYNPDKQAKSYQLKASDPDGICTYKFEQENINIAPGSTGTVTLTVAFKKTPLIGPSKICRFIVSATKTTGEVKTVAGQLESSSRIPLWAFIVAGIALVAVIVVVVVMAKGSKDESAALPTTSTSTTSATTKLTTTTTTSTSTSVIPTTIPTITTSTSTTITKPTTTTATTTTTSAATTTSTPAVTSTTTSTANTPPDLNGSWDFTVTVTVANGVCAGEGGTSKRTMKITQNGENITIAGFKGSLDNKLSGKISLDGSIWVINVSGSYPEDGGTTTASHRLEVKSTSEISGVEDWEWTGGGGSCPGGKADVSAKRAPST